MLRSAEESASLSPQPGLAELDRLLEQVQLAGQPVELRVVGGRVDVPPGVDLAAYRVVQEGLTNALRHASAQRACVTLRYLPAAIEIAVEDDGRGPQRQDGGLGLVGVRERVSVYGGTVEFGPAQGAGSRLAVSLPVREPR